MSTVFLMLSTMLLLLRLSLMPHTPEQAAPKAPSEDVTYLDLSGPAEPESNLPEITKKGPL